METAQFRSMLIKALELYEGRKDFLYKDSVGQVTVGVGCLVRHRTDASNLILVSRSNKRNATPAEKEAAFDAVMKEPMQHLVARDHKMHIWGASHYQSVAGASDLFMPAAEIDRRRDLHVAEFSRYLTQKFTPAHGYKNNFAAFPEPVRLALYDMMFNLGPTKFPATFPTLTKAIKAEDWTASALASRRPQLGSARNRYVNDLFLQAASGQGIGLRPLH